MLSTRYPDRQRGNLSQGVRRRPSAQLFTPAPFERAGGGKFGFRLRGDHGAGELARIGFYARCASPIGFSGQVFNDMGEPYLLPAIAVVVIGGTLMTGGRGHYLGMLGGALLLTALTTVLTGLLLPVAMKSVIFGLVIVLAVLGLRERSGCTHGLSSTMERDMALKQIRRIVTTNDENGKSGVLFDGIVSHTITVLTEMWITDRKPESHRDGMDHGEESNRLEPPPGGTLFRYFVPSLVKEGPGVVGPSLTTPLTTKH